GVGDDMLVPKVGVQLEVRLGAGQRMPESMMEKDVVHPVLPASDTVMRVEDCVTEAASVEGGWINMAKMGQAMENPFFVVGIREILEAVQEIEGAFQHSCPPGRTDDQGASLVLGEERHTVKIPGTHGRRQRGRTLQTGGSRQSCEILGHAIPGMVHVGKQQGSAGALGGWVVVGKVTVRSRQSGLQGKMPRQP
ncbi:MAG: hypothetical protein Q9168_008001, partial [Polycauliona sp. 1 TL-2023]